MNVRIILREHANAGAVHVDHFLSFFNSKNECREAIAYYTSVYISGILY